MILKRPLSNLSFKKSNLVPNIFKNYRPESKLCRPESKLVEKIVASRLNEHIDAHGLSEKFQSAYRKYHSTESALLRVQNDINMALQNRKLCALVLLDLSSAFDTINHSRLLSRLSTRYGISDTALAWINSYLSDRTQRVSVEGYFSPDAPLLTGVPQGSVLGPILFTMFMAPVGDILRDHGISHHFYADDTQIYVFFDVKDSDSACHLLETCVQHVKEWMLVNGLKLNDDKTEVILIGSRYFRSKLSDFSIKVGENNVCSVSSVRNLGVIFNQSLSMETFVFKKCQIAVLNLRSIAGMRKYMDVDIAKTLIQKMVISKLDYGNGLLYGVNKKLMRKLQLIQNSAARPISKIPRRTQILRHLHWLPIEARVHIKVLRICFKCLNGRGPQYLSDLLLQYTPKRALRSSSQLQLVIPKTKSKFGERAFEVFAP